MNLSKKIFNSAKKILEKTWKNYSSSTPEKSPKRDTDKILRSTIYFVIFSGNPKKKAKIEI